MDEADHLAAVVELLTAAGAEPMTLQELEDAPELPPYYTEVHVMERDAVGPRRGASASDIRQWRILTRAVGQRYANAQEMRACARVLHEASLTVGDETYYIERSATDDPIAADDGWWSGTSEFTY